MSYVYDAHIFHYAVEGGLVFMCMADGDFGRRLPFAFIDDVVRRWTETYADRGQTALAYGMNEDFSRVLQRQMDYLLDGQRRGLPPRRQLRVRPEHDQAQSCAIALRSPASERPSDLSRYSPDIQHGSKCTAMFLLAVVRTAHSPHCKQFL